MCCTRKYGLIIISVFEVCIGLAAIGTAAAVIHQHNKFDLVLTSAYYAVQLNQLLTGISLVLRYCVVCIGAIKGNSCVRTTYSVVVGMVLVVVLITAIILLVFTSNATNFLTDSMTDVFKEYGEEGEVQLTLHLDDLQHEGQCCGVNGYEDWENFPYLNGTSVADGCCKNWTVGCGVGMLNKPNVTELVWSDGCLDYVYSLFAVICIALAILSLILVGLQIVNIAWVSLSSGGSGGYEPI